MRKVLEILEFQALGSFETLGSKLSHGTSLKFADVRTHLRKVFRMTLSSFKKEATGFFFIIDNVGLQIHGYYHVRFGRYCDGLGCWSFLQWYE